MKNRSLWMNAVAALLLATALAGCGGTTYFAGRSLPPSGLTNRVLIAIQNPSSSTTGALQFVDAYYDIRYKYNSTNTAAAYTISGFSGALPLTIQNMPEEQIGAVYNYGSGTFSLINYAKEVLSSTISESSLGGSLSASIFTTRNQSYIFAASKSVLTVVDNTNSTTYALDLSGIDSISVNPGGSVALVFVKNSNYVYYPVKLTSNQTTSYAGGYANWPQGAVDCEPVNAPGWCLFQARDSSNNKLLFDRPVKAVFSADGGTAYVLNCGPECGGSTASVTPLSVAPMIYLMGQRSGSLPTNTELSNTTILTPGGASNALVDSSTLYVVGQEYMPDKYWGGHLTVVDLSTSAISSTVSISDGTAGGPSRMILADDDTLWIAMTKCNQGERFNNSGTYGVGNYGCLTMFNTSTNTVTMLEPYIASNGIGDATGIAAVTDLHKIYAAVDGQVYIYRTTDGAAIDNQYVTVTGTAVDVAYMDGLTDANNTVY